MTDTVLGIDPSLTCTSLVALHGDEHRVHRVETDPKRFSSPQHRLAYMRRRLESVLDEHWPVKLVAIEGYAFGSRTAQHSIAEWGGLLRYTLWLQDFAFVEVPPTTIKSFVTGKGNSEKALMLREVFRKWGFEAFDDNDADAYCCARFAQALLLPAITKARQAWAATYVPTPTVSWATNVAELLVEDQLKQVKTAARVAKVAEKARKKAGV